VRARDRGWLLTQSPVAGRLQAPNAVKFPHTPVANPKTWNAVLRPGFLCLAHERVLRLRGVDCDLDRRVGKDFRS